MTTGSADKKNSTIPTTDYLIRGEDYLAKFPDFKLVGRTQELDTAANVLMRKDNNNLIIFGQNGVGLSSVVKGLQASKDDPNTPFDIVGKTFYWLDIDALFSSGDPARINEEFQRTMATLKKIPDSVLVIDNTKDFLDGVRNTNVSNIINMLMRETRLNKDFQVIFETREENIGELYKAHADAKEIFTLLEIREPAKTELVEIVNAAIPGLEAHHGVSISPDAVKMVIDLTTKYPGLTLGMAQPKRSSQILEGALTAYRHKMHSKPHGLEGLETTLATVIGALEGKPAKGALAGKSPAELETIRLETENEIREVKESFTERQGAIRKIFGQIRLAEENIRRLDDEIEAEKRRVEENIQKGEEAAAKAQTEGDKVPEVSGSRNILKGFAKAGVQRVDADTPAAKRERFIAEVVKLQDQYQKLTKEMNADLVLKPEHVLGEFSRLSGVPMNKLQQDESEKLLNLENTLRQRVFGQEEPITEVSRAVRRGRAGLKKSNKPIGSFIFMGPSGVGKTELAKALAAALFDDEGALQVYDMSEYMEKHASAKLIGSPPGYEGYEAGGILTNNMRRKPYTVNVFDEIEKANKSVFDLFLQIVDEGRLTDNKGIVSSFGNSINIMTSNIGARYFLDESLTFEEAKKKALADLWNPDPEIGGFRPEFLNRFTGIFCFNRLGQPEIMLIAGKALKDLNSWIADKGLEVVIDQENKAAMCLDKYQPRNGARGIMNYIEREITSDVADTILRHPDKPGKIVVTYDKVKQEAETEFIPLGAEQKPAATGPANQNTVELKAAAAAFKPKP